MNLYVPVNSEDDGKGMGKDARLHPRFADVLLPAEVDVYPRTLLILVVGRK